MGLYCHHRFAPIFPLPPITLHTPARFVYKTQLRPYPCRMQTLQWFPIGCEEDWLIFFLLLETFSLHGVQNTHSPRFPPISATALSQSFTGSSPPLRLSSGASSLLLATHAHTCGGLILSHVLKHHILAKYFSIYISSSEPFPHPKLTHSSFLG